MQPNDPSTNPMSDEEIRAWCNKSYQDATAYLAKNGMITESVVLEKSRYLPPIVAVWQLKSSENEFYWAISDTVKSDYIPTSAAATARDAVKIFSLRWQLEVEKLNDEAESSDETNENAQKASIKELEVAASSLYQLYENEVLWHEE